MATQPVLPAPEKPEYSQGKHLAEKIFLDTLAEIDVRHAMLSKLKREAGALKAGSVSMPLLSPPHVVAFGKAANRMAATFYDILDGKVAAGVVVAPSEPSRRLPPYRYFTGGHPYPTQGTLDGAMAALELLEGVSSDDFVIFLVSGGGSALFECPLEPGVTLADLIEFNRLLVTGKLPIEHINTLRKHISAVKGGRLAARAYPARQLTIFISDVPDHLPSMVASGPTMPDESTVGECYRLAEDAGIVPKLPESIRLPFQEHTLEETPKPQDERFERSNYFCLLSNRDAVEAAKASAEKLGFRCEIDPGFWDGDNREVADANYQQLEALAKEHADECLCLLVGGETTCPVTGNGMGGRNQAFVLYAAQLIAAQKRVVLSAGTDGRDGNSPASGAVADGQTVSRATVLGMNPERHLRESDSYSFFRTLGDTLDTGFTDNNVRDLRVWLAFPE
jgi:glycerate 2-kinase